jgi:hypothetical protein
VRVLHGFEDEDTLGEVSRRALVSRRPRVLTDHGRRLLGLLGAFLLVVVSWPDPELAVALPASAVLVEPFMGEEGSCRAPEHSEGDVRLLAKVLCAECKGCPDPWERIAIGYVVLNRLEDPAWGTTLRGVLLKPGQFAAADAPICQLALPPRGDGRPWSPGMVERHRLLMGQIEDEARMVLAREIYDPVEGTFFHARRLGPIWPHLEEISVPPEWSHRFYRTVKR